MKKIINMACFISLLVASNSYAGCDCSTLSDVMADTLQSANETVKKQADEIMKKPDLSSVDDCLSGIRGALEGWFHLGLPSTDDLFNEMCKEVVDSIYDSAMESVDEALGNVGGGGSWGEFFSAGAGVSDSSYLTDSPPVTYSVSETEIDISASINELFN